MSKSTPPQNEADSEAGGDVQRWTARRKALVVLELLKGKTTAAEVARQHALTVGEVERWRDDFIAQGTEGLRSHPRDLAEQHEAEKQKLLARVGELTLAVDVFKKVHRLLGKDLPEGIL